MSNTETKDLLTHNKKMKKERFGTVNVKNVNEQGLKLNILHDGKWVYLLSWTFSSCWWFNSQPSLNLLMLTWLNRKVSDCFLWYLMGKYIVLSFETIKMENGVNLKEYKSKKYLMGIIQVHFKWYIVFKSQRITRFDL